MFHSLINNLAEYFKNLRIKMDHINLDDIYQDILPSELKYSKLSSIMDRLSLYTFLRSSFITYDDGDYINLSTKFSKNKV